MQQLPIYVLLQQFGTAQGDPAHTAILSQESIKTLQVRLQAVEQQQAYLETTVAHEPSGVVQADSRTDLPTLEGAADIAVQGRRSGGHAKQYFFSHYYLPAK
jgi:hypothetical protein